MSGQLSITQTETGSVGFLIDLADCVRPCSVQRIPNKSDFISLNKKRGIIFFLVEVLVESTLRPADCSARSDLRALLLQMQLLIAGKDTGEAVETVCVFAYCTTFLCLSFHFSDLPVYCRGSEQI